MTPDYGPPDPEPRCVIPAGYSGAPGETLRIRATGDQLALLAGLGQARPGQLPEILEAGRRLEQDAARFRDGAAWYQRARSAAGSLIIGALRSIGRGRFPFAPERDDTAADDDHEDWANPYSWRPGDPEL